MTRSHLVLLIPGDPPGEGAWRVGRMSPDGPMVESLAAGEECDTTTNLNALASQLREQGYKGEPVVLGLPTSMCLFARMPNQTGVSRSKPNRRSRDAWAYKLEERLPVAAEQVVADFIWQEDAVLGVAVLSDTLRPLVEALTSEGIRLRAIVPLSLLAVSRRARALREQRVDAAVWVSGEGLELAHLKDGEPVSWLLRDDESGAADRQLGRLTVDRTEQWRVVCYGEMDLETDTSERIDIVSQQGTTLEADAICQADLILRGSSRPPVDLLAYGLSPSLVPREVRRSLTGVFVAVLLVIVTLTGLMHLRAQRYQAEASASRAAESQLFREAFPGKPLPVNVRSRLVSEHRKLQALGSASNEDQSERSALNVLFDTLACLPTDMPYSIEKMTIGGHSLLVEGLTRTHGDADTLAATVRDAVGWRVETPRTEQLRDGTVRFTITAVSDPTPRVAWTGGIRGTGGGG